MNDRRQMMQDYLEALDKRADYGQYFASDVILAAMGTDQSAIGREAAVRQMRDMHERIFDAHIEVKSLLVDNDKAAVEADFTGTHIGKFAGIAPAGREVRVSYAVVYDLRGDQISELRIYFPMAQLMEQLTGPRPR
jgi:predicted ester cyclase